MKTLILVCDNYPIGLGEFFLDDEIKIAETYFDKIIVMVPKEQYQSFDHYTSDKLVVYEWTYQLKLSLILSSLPFIFSSNTFRELFRMRKQTGLKNLIKILVNDALKSSYLMNQVRTVLTKEQINPKESVFYSYWNDYKALALARLKQKINGTFISRAHSSDIFAFRSTFNYLPYKRFILSNLDQTYSVSEIGKTELEKYIEEKDIEKVSISRLGKQNLRAPLFEKTDEKIIICSCSHFNHLKRVHLIPKILKKVNLPNIHWVHFGWGYPEYEKMVNDEAINANFQYIPMGVTDNQKILDFYNGNYVDIFINTSSHEGIPVSIMEAFSAGIPVMATNVGAVSEIVNENCGFLIDVEVDVQKSAKKIYNYLSSEISTQQSIRKNAFMQWKNHFEVTRNYSSFYEKLKMLNENPSKLDE